MYERILVALDGSEDAEQVLPNVQALAEKFGSEVVVLRATVASEEVLTATTPGTALGDVPIVDPTPIVEAEEDVALRYLHEVSARLTAAGLRVTTDHQEGPASDVIIRRARELNIGLIAMTTTGRGGLGRLVFGSVAESVLHHAECPLLLVRVTPS
jgi:nucleotide-binding universal stress UspA family protein